MGIYLEKVADWQAFGYQLLPEEKENLVEVASFMLHDNNYFVLHVAFMDLVMQLYYKTFYVVGHFTSVAMWSGNCI